MRRNALAYVAVVSNEPLRVASLFGDVLGLMRTDTPTATGAVPVFAVGGTAIAVFEPHHPLVGGAARSGVHHIAFAEADLAAARSRLADNGIVVGAPEAGLDGERCSLARETLCGVSAYITRPLTIAASRSAPVRRIDHLGIASADNQAAISAFCGRLGLVLESQQTDMEAQMAVESFTSDKYGVVYHTRAPQIQGGLRVAFITAGDLELEFLQNFDPAQASYIAHGAAGTTRQDQGAITRYIETRGAGLHHIAFNVADINSVLAAVRARGFATIDSIGRPGSRRALIGFVHPKALGGLLVHFVQRDELPS